MARHRKNDGTITLTGADGRITGNIASAALNGPPMVISSLTLDDNGGGKLVLQSATDAAIERAQAERDAAVVTELATLITPTPTAEMHAPLIELVIDAENTGRVNRLPLAQAMQHADPATTREQLARVRGDARRLLVDNGYIDESGCRRDNTIR